MIKHLLTRKIIFVVAAVACLSTYFQPAWALLLGLLISQLVDKPFPQLTHKVTTTLLQISIVGLGFGMNATGVIQAGQLGLIFTVISVLSVLGIGILIGRWLLVDQKTSLLTSLGTAICGGSAIAAISPIIKADEKQTSVALGIIFILNAIALFAFPAIGHWLELSQIQFGLWSAIAIHDTSQVVGAASSYGLESLEVATSVKLLRTLWIIPVAFTTAFIFKAQSKRVKIPWFIAFFVLAIVSNTYFDFIPSEIIVRISKTGMTFVLFLIGASLSREAIKSVGLKPFVQGVSLWVMVAVVTLLIIIRM